MFQTNIVPNVKAVTTVIYFDRIIDFHWTFNDVQVN